MDKIFSINEETNIQIDLRKVLRRKIPEYLRFVYDTPLLPGTNDIKTLNDYTGMQRQIICHLKQALLNEVVENKEIEKKLKYEAEKQKKAAKNRYEEYCLERRSRHKGYSIYLSNSQKLRNRITELEEKLENKK